MITDTIANFKILEVIRIQRQNMQLKTESKECYVLSCRIHGESTFFYNGTSHRVCRGDVLYIPHGSSYSQSCEDEEILAIHFALSGSFAQEIQVFTPAQPEETCQLFQSIYQLWQQKPPGYIYHCLADLYKLAALTHFFDADTAGDSFGIITPSVRYLQAHFCDPDLSMETVSRQSPLSQTSFIKHFRKYFSCTPIQYVHTLRIQKAQLLLCSGLYTREEIAQLCGFENVKHFYTVFKKLTGCATGAYLKRTESKQKYA